MNKSQVKRRLLTLLGAGLLLLAAGSALLAYRRHRHAVEVASWRDQGLAAEATGDYSHAVEKLGAYLAVHPDDEAVLRAYIDARPRVELPHAQHLTDTILATHYLLQLEPDLKDYRLKLLDLYRQLGLRAETVETADTILKSDPKNSHALELKTQTLLAQSKLSEARDCARLWADADPLNLLAQITVLSCDSQQGTSGQDLLAEADKWAAAQPDRPHQAELLKAIVFSLLGQREDALLWLRKAAQEPAPDDRFADILVANFQSIGDVGEDVSVLRNMVAHGAGEGPRLKLLQRLWELSQYKEAGEVAQKLDLGKPAAPATALAMALDANRASGQLAEGNRLRDLLALRKDPVAIAWTAILTPRGNDPASARGFADRCRSAIASDPGNAYLRYYLGESMESLGETDLAIEAWEQAAQLNQTWSLPLARLADALLEQGNTDRAARAATLGLHRSPNALTALAVAHVAAAVNGKGNAAPSDSVLRLIDEVEKASPGNPDAELVRLEVLARAGKNDRAVAQIRAILNGKTPPAESLLMQILGISRANRLGLDAEVLDADERLHGQTPDLMLNRATSELASGHGADGLRLIENAAEKAPPADALAWRAARAQYLDLSGNPAAAAAWNQLSEQNPGDLGIQKGALAARSLQGDRKSQEAIITRMKGILGDQSLFCTLARVRLLVATRSGDADDKEIAETFKSVIAAHPELPEPRLLWAQSLEKLGKTDEAIEQLEVAANGNPQSSELALRLAGLYRSKGDYQRSCQQLDRVVDTSSSNPPAIRRAAGMLADEGDTPKAISALVQLGQNADDSDKLMLARLYQAQGKVDRTDQLVSELMQNPSPAPDAIDLAVRVYAAEGKSTQAEDLLASLDQQKLAPGRQELIQADYAAASGEVAKATAGYRRAIAEAPGNAAYRRALIAYLFSEGKSTEAISEAAAAAQAIGGDKALAGLRDAAGVLSATASVPEVRSLLLQYVQDPLDNPAALDALTGIAKASQAGDLLSIVPQAGLLAQQYPRFAGVQMWAIGVYLRTGRISDASSAISKALQAFPDSVEIAGLATAFYRTQNRFDDMLDAARSWNKSSGGAAASKIAIAHALVGLNRPNEAIELLKPLVPAAQKDPDHQAELLVQYADALRGIGNSEQARDLLLPLTANSPSLRVQCLRFAAQNLDPAEGQVWIQTITPEMKTIEDLTLLGDAWASLSTRMGGKNVCTDRAAGVFSSIEARGDAPAGAIEQAAMFAEQSGDNPSAIRLYERTLSLDPKRPVSANNLAWALLRTGGDLAKAAGYATSATELSPDQPEFFDTLASVRIKTGDYAAAGRCIQRAIDLQGDNPRWRIELAQIYCDGGEKTEAVKVISGIDAMGIDLRQLPESMHKQLEALRAQVSPPAPGAAGPGAASVQSETLTR